MMKFNFQNIQKEYGEIMFTPALMYASEDYYRAISLTFLFWCWSIEWRSL